jgi:hypothetical protein
MPYVTQSNPDANRETEQVVVYNRARRNGAIHPATSI